MLIHVMLMDPTPEDEFFGRMITRLKMPMPPRVGEYLWLRPVGGTNEDTFEYRVLQVVYGHNALPDAGRVEPQYAVVHVRFADADEDRLGAEPAYGV